MPTGTTGQSMPAFSYTSPIDATPPTVPDPSTQIQSNLPQVVGSLSTSNSPISILYTALSTIQTTLNEIGNSASSVIGVITGGTLATTLDSVANTVGDIARTVEDGDQSFYEIYNAVTPVLPTITKAMTGIYAGLIAIAAVAMTATILMAICSMYKCRYLLYLTCLIFALIGAICLLVTTLLSALITPLYFACDFTTTSFSGP